MTKPFKLKAPEEPETSLHAQVADLLDKLLAPPARWTTRGVGHIELSGQQAAKLRRLGLKPNWPDIEIECHGSYSIELKVRSGRLSKARIVRSKSGRSRFVEGQTEEFPRLEAAGVRIAICESVDDVIAALRAWKLPLRISVGSELVEKIA